MDMQGAKYEQRPASMRSEALQLDRLSGERYRDEDDFEAKQSRQ